MEKNNTFYYLILYCVLIIALLLLVISGAKVYQNAIASQTRNEELREALAFIQSQIAGCEGKDGAYLAEGPEGMMLCLPESDSRFETRIYLFRNTLRTEMCNVNEPVMPAEAEIISYMGSLELYKVQNGFEIIADGYHAFAACNE